MLGGRCEFKVAGCGLKVRLVDNRNLSVLSAFLVFFVVKCWVVGAGCWMLGDDSSVGVGSGRVQRNKKNIENLCALRG